MQFAYDISFEPPAPVVDVSFGRPNSQDATQLLTIRGLVDSGADVTVVPQWVTERLKLCPVDEVLVAGYAGEANLTWLYSTVMVIAELEPKIVRIVTMPDVSTVLIGRDVINEWSLVLDGREQVLRITYEQH